MILVEVRCRSCGRLLDMVVSAPPAGDVRWGDWVYLHMCPWHHPDGGHGNVRAWQERRRRAGKQADRRAIGRWAPWAELRPKVEKARRTGRSQVHAV